MRLSGCASDVCSAQKTSHKLSSLARLLVLEYLNGLNFPDNAADESLVHFHVHHNIAMLEFIKMLPANWQLTPFYILAND